MKILLGIVLAFLTSIHLQAQAKPGILFGQQGSDLLAKCKNISLTEPGGHGDPSQLDECIGYINGVVDGSTLGSLANANNRFPVCIPAEVSRGQLVRVVLKYGNDHPENLHWVAARLVTEALMAAFPCSDKN